MYYSTWYSLKCLTSFVNIAGKNLYSHFFPSMTATWTAFQPSSAKKKIRPNCDVDFQVSFPLVSSAFFFIFIYLQPWLWKGWWELGITQVAYSDVTLAVWKWRRSRTMWHNALLSDHYRREMAVRYSVLFRRSATPYKPALRFTCSFASPVPSSTSFIYTRSVLYVAIGTFLRTDPVMYAFERDKAV